MDTNGLLCEDIRISLASGEITCNPRKDEIFDAVDGYPVSILTNGILFDERLAKITAKRGNILNISVDAGTSDSYRRIKSVDAFKMVVANIKQYAEYESNIELKYILLPQNANHYDIEAFIQLAKDAGAKYVILTSDYFRLSEYTNEELENVEYFKYLADKAGISCYITDMSNRYKLD